MSQSGLLSAPDNTLFLDNRIWSAYSRAVRICSASDIHIANHTAFSKPGARPGINSRGELCLLTLENCLKLGLERGCEVFLVSGDLLHSSKPPPVLLYAIGGLFRKYLHIGYQEVLLTLGNHEATAIDSHHNSLSPLANIPGVIVADTRPVVRRYGRARVVMAPYRRDAPTSFLEPTVRSLLQDAPGDGLATILSVHFGLLTDKTPKSLVKFASKGAMDCKELSRIATENGVHAVLMGDFHTKESYEPRKGACCYQPGALCPASFGDPPGPGHAMIWDSSRPREVEFVPVEGPQFIKVPGSWEGLEARDDRFYRIQGPIEEVQRLEAEAPAGALYDTVVTTDSSVSERVSKVTHADNINETVAEYVSAMNLDPALAKQVTDRVLSAISS